MLENIKPNRIYQLSGDVNPLDYGATYFRWDGDQSFDVWNLHRLEDGNSHKYRVTEYSIDLSDLNDRSYIKKFAGFVGMEKHNDFEEFMLSKNILWRLDAAVSYGNGNTGTKDGNNAIQLLGFNPSLKKYPTM